MQRILLVSLAVLIVVLLLISIIFLQHQTIPQNIIKESLLPGGESIEIIGTPTNPYNSFSINHIGINTNLWNMANSSVGNVTMTLNSKLIVNLSFVRALYEDSPTVLGYPEILYGVNIWGGGIPSPSEILPLPIVLSNLSKGVYLEVNYSIKDLSNTPIDFAYDIWMTRNVTTSGATHGDIELMIWLYHTAGTVPAGSYVTTIRIPAIINGKTVYANWEVYVDNGSSNTWSIITFSVDISGGDVMVNLSNFINGTVYILSHYFNWNSEYIYNLHLQTIDLGSEFRPNPNGEVMYSFEIYSYDIVVKSQ